MSEYSQAISCTQFLIGQSRFASYHTSILMPVWSPLKRCTVSKWKPYILILLTTGIYNIPQNYYYGVLSSFSKDESCSKALSKGLLDSFEAFHSLHNRPIASDFAAYYMYIQHVHQYRWHTHVHVHVRKPQWKKKLILARFSCPQIVTKHHKNLNFKYTY